MAPLKMMSRAITFLAAAALLPASPLWAAEFRSDQTVTVAAEERIDGNLYAFGERVVIDGVVDGDLVTFGSQITINGTVEGDVAGAGQTIVVAGKIGDDARIAGQVLKLDQQAQIGGDLLAGGFSLELAPGSAVEGDVTYGGFQALLAGKIVGDVTSGLANCQLSGETTGDIKLEVGGDPDEPPPPSFGPPPPVAFPSVPGGLTVTDTAHIGGSLAYKSFHEAKIDPGAAIDGDVQFELQVAQPAQAAQPTPADHALVHARRFGALLLVGLAAILIAPGWTTRLGENARTRLIPCFGWGIVAIAAVIVGMIALLVAAIVVASLAGAAGMGGLVAVVIVGAIVSLLAAIVGMWLVCSYLAQMIVALAAGGLVARGSSRLVQAVALALGLIAVLALTNVPYAAGVLAMIIVIVGFGSLWISCRDTVRGTRPVEQRTPSPALKGEQKPQKPVASPA